MKKIIIPLVVIVILFIAFLLINDHTSVRKLYFISPLNMYLETIYYPKDDYGYIVFGKNRDIELGDSVDYISVSKKTGDRCAIIFVDSAKQNELNFIIPAGIVYKQDSVKYKLIIYKSRGDIFNVQSQESMLHKNQYLDIEISEFFEAVFLSNYKDSCLYRLNPVSS